MSPDGHSPPLGAAEPSAVVATFPMSAGDRFHWHTHEDHQLAWAVSGVLSVLTESATWVLPPTRALWIPCGILHETVATSRAMMRTPYVKPALCPIDWPLPTPVSVKPLLGELIEYLADEPLDADMRAHGEAMLVDLLEPEPVSTVEVRFPADERAREVAEALAADPTDKRTLAEWGREVGASERTLARAFVEDTGIPFGHWRTRLRLQAALVEIAGGSTLSAVAARVGYDTTSAFVAAFHRETGMTPSAYFRVALPSHRHGGRGGR